MKRIIITAAVLAMLIMGVTAKAENEIKVVADSDTRIITVSGELGEANAKKRVMITVLSKGGTESDMDTLTDLNISQNVAALYMVYTNEQGVYETKFKLNSGAGEYTAVVSGYGKTDRYSTAFFNPGDVSLIVKDLEKARSEKSASGIKAILDAEENLRSLGLGKADDEIYGVKYTDLNSESFTQLANCEKQYKLAADFLEAYYEAAVVRSFNLIDKPADVEANIEKCDDILAIKTTKAYGIYTNLKNKSAVNTDIQKGGFKSVDDIVKRFCDSVYLNTVATMQNWSEFSELVSENNDYIGFDLSGYNKLLHPSEVDKVMAGKEYKSVEDMKTAFINAVKDATQKESKTGSGGSSGGGSGGSSSVSGFSAVYPSVPITTDTTDVSSDDTSGGRFGDIASVPWAQKAIEWLAEKSILSGKGNGEFCPNDTLTREECAKILVEAFSVDKNGVSCSFSDIDSSHWAYIYVAAAQNAGMISGYEDGSFGIGRGVTRQEFAVMLYRIAAANGVVFVSRTEAEFKDSDLIAAYAKDAVKALSGAGIINGKNGSFAPDDKCTRAEAAKMLYEILNIGGEDREDA